MQAVNIWTELHFFQTEPNQTYSDKTDPKPNWSKKSIPHIPRDQFTSNTNIKSNA